MGSRGSKSGCVVDLNLDGWCEVSLECQSNDCESCKIGAQDRVEWRRGSKGINVEAILSLASCVLGAVLLHRCLVREIMFVGIHCGKGGHCNEYLGINLDL